jgi:hypothetical protein
MRRLLSAAIVLGAFLSLSAPAFALEAGLRGEYWFPKISGNAQTTTSGLPNTPFDLKSTLGVQDENTVFGEAYLRVGRFTFRGGYTPLKYDGQSTLTATLVFNGQTFAVNDTVVSQVELKMIDGQVQFDLLRPDAGVVGFNLGLILQGKYVDGSIEVGSSTVPATRQDFTLAAPMVGVAAGVGFLKDFVRVDARAAGIAYSGSHCYEADGYLSVIPFPFVRLQGGYRYIDLKVDESDVQAALKLQGPYVGLQLSF